MLRLTRLPLRRRAADVAVHHLFLPYGRLRLTRKLIDIESTTGMEAAVAVALDGELRQLGYNVERMCVEGDRVNIWATHPRHPNPANSCSQPTWTPCRHSFHRAETDDRIYGRGSCDAKGIIVAQIAAAEKLKAEGIYVRTVIPGRRGTRQPGRADGQPATSRLEVPHQRRAHGKSAGRRDQRNAARGTGRQRAHGTLGLSGAR